MEEIQRLEDIDILNRTEFIGKIISTVEYHSKNSLKTSFSIQGEWGCGKSWILDRVFEQLYDIQDEKIAGGRYCVFRYNAWKYDYYDEPLISLLISLKEQFEASESVFFKSQKAQENYKVVKKLIKESLLDCIEAIQKSPLINVIDSSLFHISGLICSAATVKRKIEQYKETIKDEIRKYDPHYDLNTLMNSIIEGLNKIADNKTIVVLVDELDRCLPKHAIKVLERMHHISQNVNNIQFIYGIDKTQIENNVAHIFMSENNNEKIKQDRIKKYLSKFISFGLQVPKAEYSNEIEKKYPSLFSSFDNINTCTFDIIEKIRIIAAVVTPRVLEQVIQKIILANGILCQNNEKQDFSVLVYELFYAIAQESNFDFANSHLNNDYHQQILELRNHNNMDPIRDIFNTLIASNPVMYGHIQRFQTDYPLWINHDSRMKAIFESSMLFYFERTKGNETFYFEDKGIQKEMEENTAYLKQFISYYVSLDM
ncbi:P-loop NTPase fold protein [Treponema bryantii]|uniref:KAP family P-loop NTPase fold protein n=1 Tax=Treponema bryantii TaxID=163 RepID=UPI0003B490EB|nr:P-loop NTPase fold protein [Treponema bryantii]